MKERTEEEIKSAVAWKDGFVVHALYSPYRRGIDVETYHVDKVPPGLIVNDFKGIGSQQASARVTGKMPDKLTVDVGNQDVTITRQRGNRVRLSHARDTIGSRSQLTVGHNISRRRGRVYHTRAGGGTIISRRPMRGY